MRSTSTSSRSLATLQSITAEPRPDDRMVLRRLRVELAAIVADATAYPAPRWRWEDLMREQPRSSLPCLRERTMIHAAIRAGQTSPARVLAYRLAQLADDLAQFKDAPTLCEVLYTDFVRANASAMEAQLLARCLPSPEHHEHAIARTEHAITIGRAYCQLGRQGKVLFPPPSRCTS